jgi:exopolysaccharide biosynthesis polyprenyl glycosylphosphotransferase
MAIIYASIWLAFIVLESKLTEYERNFNAFEIIVPFISVLYLILMYGYGMYNITRRDLPDVIYTVFLLSISMTVGIMGVCFFVRDVALAFPRSVVLLGSAFYLVMLIAWRLLIWLIEQKTTKLKKVAIIGKSADHLKYAIRRRFHSQYEIVYQGDVKLGDDEFEKNIISVDEIFLSADLTHEERDKVIQIGIRYNKSIFFIPKFLDINLISASISRTDDLPTYLISTNGPAPEELFIKRSFDIVMSLIALIIFFPIGLLLALFVLLDGGPLFYCQTRLTKDHKPFRMIKFRTMIPDAEKLSGPVLAGEDDPRITGIGKFLRMTRLDELPQLINILKGDMSIVGPRPERPFFVEQFEKEMPEYQYRLRMKTGLTGLAQVEGRYNTSVENKLRYDLIYINKFSIWRDLLIIIQTVKILFLKESTEGVSSNEN